MKDNMIIQSYGFYGFSISIKRRVDTKFFYSDAFPP